MKNKDSYAEEGGKLSTKIRKGKKLNEDMLTKEKEK